MPKTVMAVYDSFRTANAVVRELVENGFSRQDISLASLDETGNLKEEIAGLPPEQIEAVTAAVDRGGTMVAVITDDDMAAGARSILNRYDPLDLESHHGDRVDAREDNWKDREPELEEEIQAPRQESNERITGSSPGVTYPPTDTYTVEQLDQGLESHISSPFDQGYEAFEQQYRQHYKANYTRVNQPYENFIPAYRYGYALAADERYRHQDWDVLEPQAREMWESKERPGPWETFKDAVYFAWEEVRNMMK